MPKLREAGIQIDVGFHWNALHQWLKVQMSADIYEHHGSFRPFQQVAPGCSVNLFSANQNRSTGEAELLRNSPKVTQIGGIMEISGTARLIHARFALNLLYKIHVTSELLQP